MSLEKSILLQLSKKLQKQFGQGKQLFLMEYPPRLLNPAEYAYDTTSSNSTANKPQSVAEAEHRLTDSTFNLAPIVAGPTGMALSNIYTSLIDNFVPNLESIAKSIKDKVYLKKWLQEATSGQVLEFDVDTATFSTIEFEGTRIELCNKIYQTYLIKKDLWNQAKENRRYQAIKEGKENEFNKWLASHGQIMQEIVDTYYKDSIVRGDYHEVQTAISYIDMPTIGARLETTRMNIRESKLHSLSGGGSVYPVRLQPSDWFKYLLSPPNPVELLQNADAIRAELKSKQSELRALQDQKASLVSMNSSKDTIKKYENDVISAKSAVQKAEETLRESKGKRLLQTASILIDSYNKLVQYGSPNTGFMTYLRTQATGISETDKKRLLDDTGDNLKNMAAHRAKLNSAALNLSDLQAKYSLANSTQYSKQIELLNERITIIADDIEELKNRISSLPRSQREVAARLKQSKKSPDISLTKLKELLRDAEVKETVDTSITDPIKYLNSIKESFLDMDGNPLTPLNKTNFRTIKDGFQELGIDTESRIDATDTFNKLKNIDDNNRDEFLLACTVAQTQINNIKEKDTTTISNSVLTKLKNAINAINKNKAKLDKLKSIEEKLNPEDDSNINELIRKAIEAGLDQSLPPPADSGFATIVSTMDKQKASSYASTYSSSSTNTETYDYWFWSKSKTTTSTSSGSDAGSESSTESISVKFRALKVTIDRGQWFSPEIFLFTSNMHHINPDIVVSKGMTREQLYKAEHVSNSTGLLPAYPVSFLVIKDLEVIMSGSKSYEKISKSHSDKDTAENDGWFFNDGRTAGKTTRTYKDKVNGTEKHFQEIKDSRPKIGGWFLQLSPKDESTPYKVLEETGGDELFSSVLSTSE